MYSMKQIRDQVKKEDVSVKENFHHSSQKDASKGFGGKFGVQTDRKDKVKLYIQWNLFLSNQDTIELD